MLCSYLEDVSTILHAKEIPHKIIVGTLDDVAGIMSSAQKLGIKVFGLKYSFAHEPWADADMCSLHVLAQWLLSQASVGGTSCS